MDKKLSRGILRRSLHPKTQVCPTCCPSLICRVMWEWLENKNKKKHTQGGKKEGEKREKAKLSGGIVSHPCGATLSREGLLRQALEPRKAAGKSLSTCQVALGRVKLTTTGNPVWVWSTWCSTGEQKPKPSIGAGCGVRFINELNPASLNGSEALLSFD